MKKGIFLLLFGALIGAIVWHFYEEPAAAPALAANANLTADNIKEELARTGRIVRSGAQTVGERIDDARIIAMIKGKYVMDKSLSVFAISVDCTEGNVRLTGSVTAEEYIARAVTLATQTKGVRNVVSLLVVKN